MNYLPINETLLTLHDADCFAYYCYMDKALDRQNYSFSEKHITVYNTFDQNKLRDGREFSGYARGAWAKYSKEWEGELLIRDEKTTMMPIWVFEELVKLVSTLPMRSRSGYIRTYLWLYYLCHTNLNDYGITIERLAVLVGTNTRIACDRVNFFLAAGVLNRMGQYKFTGKDARAYHYYIPYELQSHIFDAAKNYAQEWAKNAGQREKNIV